MRTPRWLLLLGLLGAGGCAGERTIWLKLSGGKDCWNNDTPVRLLRLAAFAVTTSPPSMQRLSEHDDCFELDGKLTSAGLSAPFLERGYILQGVGPDLTLGIFGMVYSAGSCTNRERSGYLACLESDLLLPSSGVQQAELHVRCKAGLDNCKVAE